MIDDPTIDFLRHAIVITAITGFHMKNRNLPSGRNDRSQSTVRIAKYQDFIGSVLGNYIIDPREYLTDLLAKCRRTHAEFDVWGTELEIAKENIAQVLVKILPGVYRKMLAVFVEKLDYKA